MSEYQLDVDVSSGSYSVDVDVAGNPTPAGERWLNGYELSLANRERWDRLYEMEAENTPFETGYDYAVQVYETVHYKIDAQQIANTRTTTDGELVAGSSQDSYTYESQESRAEWDTDEYRASQERQRIMESRRQNETQEEDGLEITVSDVDEVSVENQPTSAELLDDPNYIRVVNGWNQKLNASSEDLSGLVPFCELYAVFDQSDIISKEDEFSTRYTSIRNRMIKVKFTGVKRAEGSFAEPPLPAGLSKDCYIVKVAGDNKSQLQSDSLSYDEDIDINTYTTSYKGVPGIGDLAVSRGSAAAQNVKYDLSITLPNPELINERFEYSKLMLMNSPFLIVYGWNIKDSNFNAEYYPPRISTMPGITNEIVVGDGIGGFWSSAIISLSNFSFSFDTVGHLVGKLTFLNSSGIFLGTLSTAAVGQVMLDQISKPSEEVIKRTGGEDNQNFIWQNGVPWSATAPDTAEAAEQNDAEGQRRIMTNFFNLENSTLAGWSPYLNESLENAGIETQDEATAIRDNMQELLQLGEDFLEKYRVKFINDLFYRKKHNMGSQNERAQLAQIQEATDWKPSEDNFGWWDDGKGPRGEQYGPGRDENNNSKESDMVIDQYFEYYIKNAWNTYFKYRFENMSRNESHSASFIIHNVQFLSGEQELSSGHSQADFNFHARVGTSTKKITYQIPPGMRARLLPLALESVINWSNDWQQGVLAGDSFIRSMPPFGRELQRTIVSDFKDRTNINYNNFYSADRKVADEVLDLIESTSVVSIPVPVSEEDRVSLGVERRSYSEVFGIDPSDGKKASVPLSKDVMVEFEFLNDIEVVQGVADDVFNDVLSKVTFFSNDVLYSLQGTSFSEWSKVENAAEFNEGSDPLIGEFGENEFNSFLSHVMVDVENNDNYQGRFAARRYAVLKNGYIVGQTKATEDDPWKDQGYAKPIVVNGEPLGLWFLKDLLPRSTTTITGDALAEGKTSEETYIASANERLAELIETRLEDDTGETPEEILLKTTIAGITSIIELQNAIVSASKGSTIMNQVNMGIANQERTTTSNQDGATEHSIFRLPVYFFLGSVLESLRIATNDKVKFFYSEVPSSKVAEPFYISIPESSANSVDAHYDAQIANIDRQLEALGAGGWREEEDEEGEIRMVEGSPTQSEREIIELFASQTRWDNYLVDYIKSRGQDKASFMSDSDDINADTAAGVYRSYTNLQGVNVAIKQFWPHYQFNNDGYHYEDYRRYQNWNGFQTARAPWIYRIGGYANYYNGQDGLALYRTNENIGERHRGFMRLWRPEDLDQLLIAKANGTSVYFRKPTGPHRGDPEQHGDRFRVSRDEAFYTDSFGQRRGRVDYGYDSAYNKDGSRDKDAVSRLRTEYDFEAEARNIDKVIGGVLGWLNWWPVDGSGSGKRYSYLGQSIHTSDYRSTATPLKYFARPEYTERVRPTVIEPDVTVEQLRDRIEKTARNIRNGWYMIDWPKERPSDGFSGADPTERMWVSGLVVKDFISLNGERPTRNIPNPTVGVSASEAEAQRSQIEDLKQQIRNLRISKEAGDLDAQFKRLPIRTTYEIPVNVNTIKQFLTSEPRAPLHKLLKKVIASAKETVPAIQLSMRPAAMNSSYIDIFPSAMNYDGVIQEIFTEVEVGSLSTDASDTMGIKDARRSVSKGRFAQSEKVIVCQFGTSQSLVETFGLASKIDPNAFSAFRLPAVVGGATMNVIEVLRNARNGNPDAYSTLLSDFGSILSDGLITGKDALKKLKIVSDGTEGASTVNYSNLETFLLSESPAISKAASTLVEDMMSQNVKLYNTILTMQNDFFTNKDPSAEGTIGEPGTRQAGSRFYGNILSTFLRTATLTIHGTTGLNVFNLVYLKGLLSGIEGLYLISNVNESLAASTFTTTLECKLIEYTNNDPQTNPIAYRGASNLNRLASLIDEAKANENAEFGREYSWNRLGDVVEQIDRRNGVFD